MASKISKETAAIQRGIGEKYGMLWSAIFNFLISFTIAFARSWKLTVALLLFMPVMACVGGLIGSVFAGNLKGQLKAYAQSAGYAEQALNAIRIVHTYCNEALELANYSKYLERA